MNIFRRAIAYIVPCGHEHELLQMNSQVEASRVARAVAERDRDDYAGTVLELAAALRSAPLGAAAREAVLTTLRRAQELTGLRLIDEQQSIAGFTAPEAGGEMPIAEDEVISDSLMSLQFQLIGVFFDAGVGRRHNWYLQRNGERVKVPIGDTEFLARVARREYTFVAGSTLDADFHIITRRRPDGEVYADYVSVRKVKSITVPPIQLELAQGAEEVPHAAAH